MGQPHLSVVQPEKSIVSTISTKRKLITFLNVSISIKIYNFYLSERS